MFAAWITERIQQYGFVENSDFVAVSEPGKNPQGGRPSKEYALTLDMAKELSMVERNERGKQARLYFIQCERQAKAAAADPIAALSDPVTLRGLLANYSQRVIALQGQVEAMTPKAQAFERIAASDGTLCITDAAKTLQVSPKDLFRLLRAQRWIYARPGTTHKIAYQDRIASGHLAHKTTTVQRQDGTEMTFTQMRVTSKGLTRLAAFLQPTLL